MFGSQGLCKILALLLLALVQQPQERSSCSASIFSFLKDNSYCLFNECCNDDYILPNINTLYLKLSEHLFGQHIVKENLIHACTSHVFHRYEKTRKPLVLSFHGTPGVGKTYVSNFIVESIFKKGLRSQFVHRFYGRADFLGTASVSSYREKVVQRVREAIVRCPRSVFIFDEVEQMPDGVFEGLTSLLDYNEIIDGVDNTQSIFIFISNTASLEIAEQLGKLLQNGVMRDETKMSDFEKILEVGAYNMAGGLKKSSLIDAHVIDHFFPFLPLEKSHVIECIRAVEKRRGLRKLSDDRVADIIKSVVTFEKKFNLFASSGCKRLEQKVVMASYSHSEL